MLFNSLSFIVFLIVVSLAHFLLPRSKRWALLLLSSYYFYMCWEPMYALIIVFSTCVDYLCGLRIYSAGSLKKRKLYLSLSIVSNLGVLLFFKYYNFFIENINSILNGYVDLNVNLGKHSFLLPVGISFYTFQTLSYTFDIYFGKLKPLSHFGKFALFVSFFPQLVAGPIERARNFIPQIKNTKFLKHNFIPFLNYFVYGMFKKVVIAETLAMYVNTVYGSYEQFSGNTLLVASIFFSFQIYCDFSGYSDMAIGVSKLFNVRLMKNFKQPYFSVNIQEFWQKWHISLSTWFKDYLYIPLGGSRSKSRLRVGLNLLIVFLVSGFWHGASWNFVIWGSFHGLAIIFIFFTKKINFFAQFKFLHPFKVLMTFLFVNFLWIFFRIDSFLDATNVLGTILTSRGSISTNADLNVAFYHGVVFVLFLLFVDFMISDKSFKRLRFRFLNNPYLLGGGLGLLVFLTIAFGFFESTSFIYFQF